MIAGVHHYPLGAELRIDVDVSLQVFVDAVAGMGRVFGHVDRGGRMQADMDAVLLADAPHGRHSLAVEGGDGVGFVIELNVEIFDVVLRGPFHAVFDPDIAAQVDADTLE
jgi:hypothetical protein